MGAAWRLGLGQPGGHLLAGMRNPPTSPSAESAHRAQARASSTCATSSSRARTAFANSSTLSTGSFLAIGQNKLGDPAGHLSPPVTLL